MKMVDVIKVVKNVKIFEKGDLIMFTDKDEDENCYGVVVKDQDPNDIDSVFVRTIDTGEITKWNGIHNDEYGLTPCKFVMHLDKVSIQDNELTLP